MKKAIAIWLCAVMMASVFMAAGANHAADGKEIVENESQYTVHAPIRIHSDADFTPANGISGGNGSESDPWIISNLDINGTGYGYCIYIANVTGYFAVRDCYLHHASGRPGVYYWNAGVSITNLNHGTIFNNTFSDNGWAITLMSANGNTVSCNNASDNEYGIYIDNCNSNIISQNIASSNSNTGIYLQSSPGNMIDRNTVSSNGQNGIRFWSTCNGNTVTNNAISFNGMYGFIISDSCYSNTVYHNNFISNTVQAADSTSGNSWHNGYPSGGNYWSNYAGVDANGDGIGDTAHAFTGGQDSYPLVHPYLQRQMVLISGWNLISFPMEQPTINGAPIRRASDLANRTLAVMISGWDPAAQAYVDYIPSFHSSSDPENFAIGPDDAIFVYMAADTAPEVSGYRSEGQRSVDLVAGWNLVGYHSLDAGSVKDDWAAQVSCGDYDDICYWDGATFVHYIFPETVMALEPGRGYFVWSDGAVTLTY